MELTKRSLIVFTVTVLSGCGEPMFENAGSQQTLIEDREACVIEIDQSPAALDYRQNPTAHPDYPIRVFEEINRCIERKGWKQVSSQQEQVQVRDTVASEVARTSPSLSITDSKSTEAIVRAVEERLSRTSNSVESGARKD